MVIGSAEEWLTVCREVTTGAEGQGSSTVRVDGAGVKSGGR